MKSFVGRFSLSITLATVLCQAIFVGDSHAAACATPPSGLVSWWRGETNALDQVDGNNGTLLNGATFAPGTAGQSFSFNGGGAHVRIPDNSSLDITNAITIEAWIYPTDVSNYHEIVSKWDTVVGVNQRSYTSGILPDGTAHLTLSPDGGAPLIAVVRSTNSLTANQWTHYAGTYDGTTMKLYINGVLQNQTAYSSGMFQGTDALGIGAATGGGAPGQFVAAFAGRIDEPSLYNRALSASEVLAIFNAGSAGKCLTTNPPACVTPPAGIVSWWRAEANALDQADGNNGTLAGNTTYAAGEVATGFVFDGSGDAVTVGNPTNLQLQNFTIETWMKRSSASQTSLDSSGAVLFGYGQGGYAFGINHNGTLFLTRVGIDNVILSTPITNTSFHHVAVTKLGTNVVFYIDGTAYPVGPYSTTYTFESSAAVGARGDNLGNSFLGIIDECSVYNRQLSASEIQSIYSAAAAGKCAPATPPIVISQPQSQTVFVGDTATLNVSAGGTAPLSYQWRRNSTNLSGATDASLVLANVQLSDAGTYAVVITNIAGSATSSNATLAVNPAGSCAPVPSGIVSWWKAETNTLDQTGTNNGTLVGNTTFTAGRVGQAFRLDGSGDGVRVGNPTNLRLQNFTIETWMKRLSVSQSSADFGGAEFFGYGSGGYAFGIDHDGTLFLTRVEVDNVTLPNAITDTNLHHVAVTKSGTNVGSLSPRRGK